MYFECRINKKRDISMQRQYHTRLLCASSFITTATVWKS